VRNSPTSSAPALVGVLSSFGVSGRDAVGCQHELGDLDRVQGCAFPQIVRYHEQDEAVLYGGITAYAADQDFVDADGGALRAERQTEAGYDVVTCPMPALVTVTGSAAEPRYPTLKGIMAAKSKPLEQLSLADLGLSGADVAPTQRVTSVSEAPGKAAGTVIAAGDDAVAKVAELLAEAKAI